MSGQEISRLDVAAEQPAQQDVLAAPAANQPEVHPAADLQDDGLRAAQGFAVGTALGAALWLVVAALIVTAHLVGPR